MIIYLYGPDSYRRRQKLNEIVAEYKKKHSALTVERFYFGIESDKEEWPRFKDFIGAQSLFGGKKLAITFGIKELKDKEPAIFLKDAVNDKNTSIILVEDERLGKDFNFLFKKPVLSQQFDALVGKQLSGFILAEAKKRKLPLTVEMIKNLSQVFKGDSWGIVTELDKAMAGGYQFLYGMDISGNNIFTALSKLSSPSLAARLSFFEYLIKTEDAAKVFNILAYQSKDKEKFAEYDIAVKSGKLDYETVLTDLLIS